MGIRVHGKRGSLIREATPIVTEVETNGRRHRSDSEPTPVATSAGSRELDPRPEKPGGNGLLRRQSIDAAELEEAPVAGPSVEPFKPPFARAAEMEARRKLRMRSRFASTGHAAISVVAPKPSPINPEVSDEESSADEDDLMGGPLETEEAPEDEFFDTCVSLSFLNSFS